MRNRNKYKIIVTSTINKYIKISNLHILGVIFFFFTNYKLNGDRMEISGARSVELDLETCFI